MPSDNRFDQPTDPALVANVAADDVSTNQQLHYAWLTGTSPLNAMWVGQVYDQFTVAVKQDSGGKK